MWTRSNKPNPDYVPPLLPTSTPATRVGMEKCGGKCRLLLRLRHPVVSSWLRVHATYDVWMGVGLNPTLPCCCHHQFHHLLPPPRRVFRQAVGGRSAILRRMAVSQVGEVVGHGPGCISYHSAALPQSVRMHSLISFNRFNRSTLACRSMGHHDQDGLNELVRWVECHLQQG